MRGSDSHTVRVDGKKLLDGGCADAVPVRRFMEMGYEKNVVVLTRPADFCRQPELTALARPRYWKYPEFVRMLLSVADVYNRQMADIRQLEREGRIFVIRLRTPLEIGRMSHDPAEVRKAYQRGREDALMHLPAMQAWLRGCDALVPQKEEGI